MKFELHPRLAADTSIVGTFELSLVLLSKDARYPWCLLVPQRSGLKELHDLSAEDLASLMAESKRLSLAMVSLFKPEKLNLAVLGNVVPQLHFHHVARFSHDSAWPGPVWGANKALAYSEAELQLRRQQLATALTGLGFKSAP